MSLAADIAPTVSRHAVTFVLITLFLDMVGFGLIMPVLPAFFEAVGKVGIDQPVVIGGWMFAGFSVAQFVFVALMILHRPDGGVHPLMTAMLAKPVPEYAQAEFQAEFQGGILAMTDVAMLLGTVVFACLFGHFMAGGQAWQSPDIAYLVAGGCMAVTTLTFAAPKRAEKA